MFRHICSLHFRGFYTVRRLTIQATKLDDNLVNNLTSSVISGCRASLARCITLVESNLPTKKKTGQAVLLNVLNHMKSTSDGKSSNSFRIGLSGPPGAGKSTFIEAFGMFLIGRGHKVAVLAVDPSSTTTGGSLMGDKTRMTELTLNPAAYIRPSPSSGNLGGVTRNTNEAIILCEAAGYDTVIVETMGVGQSEYAVADMVDMFCLLIPPAGGDELQGLKRGIVEMADVVIVNKYDGDLMPAARRVASEYMSALKFMRKRHPNWRPQVFKVSSYQRTGFEELSETLAQFQSVQSISGRMEELRCKQRLVWMWSQVRQTLIDRFEEDPRVRNRLAEVETKVKDGTLSPGLAADDLLASFLVGEQR